VWRHVRWVRRSRVDALRLPRQDGAEAHADGEAALPLDAFACGEWSATPPPPEYKDFEAKLKVEILVEHVPAGWAEGHVMMPANLAPLTWQTVADVVEVCVRMLLLELAASDEPGGESDRTCGLALCAARPRPLQRREVALALFQGVGAASTVVREALVSTLAVCPVTPSECQMCHSDPSDQLVATLVQAIDTHRSMVLPETGASASGDADRRFELGATSVALTKLLRLASLHFKFALDKGRDGLQASTVLAAVQSARQCSKAREILKQTRFEPAAGLQSVQMFIQRGELLAAISHYLELSLALYQLAAPRDFVNLLRELVSRPQDSLSAADAAVLSKVICGHANPCPHTRSSWLWSRLIW
jgi:hypothetical protein